MKIRCSFPQRILRCIFFSETFKMDFKLSTSLKSFAVSGFHPLPVKQDAEDLPLNSALHNLLSSALQVLSLGSDTHAKASVKSGAFWKQCGGRKVTANPKLLCLSSLSGTARGQCLQLLCAGHNGPLATSSGELWKDCAGALGVPGGR